eukprot:TRINITY_DN12194_c0_g3_i3.p1 TRINITY_DN12194_c0_g3~~TRINITY_DN12194_c0_g3_i3.p1  ORF type:complete len:1042 (+),score=233.77 TRINITY_DN12194_c0_g3_i3:40-3165(+)
MGVCVSQLHKGPQGLEYTSGNEYLLNEILEEIDDLVAKRPSESAVQFKIPLSWKTSLSVEQLGAHAKSAELRSNGQPMSTLENGTVAVSSFKHLQAVLNAAGSQRATELRKGLEANPDPASKILGPKYGSGADLMTIYEQNKASSTNSEQEESFFKLVLALNSIDVKLLRSSVEHLAKETNVNMQTAEAEVNMLNSFAGLDDLNCLDAINWESSYTFSDGMRAPPWRRVHGDLGYVVVKPRDGDLFYIVANVKGYWRIKGPDASGSMDTEQLGDVTPTLSELLKAKSPHFAATIDKQEFKTRTTAEAIEARGQENDMSVEAFLNAGDDAVQSERLQAIHDSMRSSRGKPNKPSASARRRVLRPSDRWASLGLDISRQQATSHRTPTASTKPPSSVPKKRRSKKPTSASSMYSRDPSAFVPRRTLQPPKPVEEFSESEEEDDEDDIEERRLQDNELPAEYWSVQKLVKYLNGGNQTATIIALCLLRDMDPTTEECQYALRDKDGLDVLMNLLDTEDVKCKLGALQILKDVTLDNFVKRDIADMNGIRPLVQLLDEENDELKGLAALTIANLAVNPRNRRMTRFYGGIERAVSLLQSGVDDNKDELARCGATMLWTCSKSNKNKDYILKAGAVPLLAQLLQSENVDLLVPVVGVLQECANSATYRDLIRQHKMVPFLVNNLRTDNITLQAHSAMTIFKCAEDSETRRVVRESDGLEPLVKLLGNTESTHLLEGATGAIWKCSADKENVELFTHLKVVEHLVGLLKSPSEAVQTNVAGALAALASNQDSCKLIRTSGGIDPLVKLLTSTNDELLINATAAVGAAAKLKENMDSIDKLDGVRLLWSLLKSANEEVQASAAWAIGPCIQNARDAGALVRSFVGGVELVVNMLRGENVQVLAAVCATVAEIARDEENLAVITDHGVVPLLCNLVNTTSAALRENLAKAIANCCIWGNNRVSFGAENAVAPLAKFLKSKNTGVKCETARALHELSKDPDNCVVMHKAGVVPPLLELVGSPDVTSQMAAASCLANIRRLALCNEMHKYG